MNARRSTGRQFERGVSLIELAVILVIIGMLLVLVMAAIPRLSERDRLDDTDVTLSEVSDAIVAFAGAHWRLPCPDSDGDGLENCAAVSGAVPYRILGFPDPVRDSAAIRARYSVYRNAPADADLAVLDNIFVPVMPASPPTVSADTPPATPDELRTVSSYPASVAVADRPAGWGIYSRGVRHYATPPERKVPATQNDLDFCLALRNARQASPNSSFLHTLELGTVTPRNVAFVLVSGGVEDAAGDGTDIAFDGVNIGSTIRFESPARRRGADYDDIVLAMPFGQLESRLSCAAITVGVNAAANMNLAASHLVAQSEDLVWQAERAVVMDGIAVRSAGFALALAILGALSTGADLAIAGTSCACPALADNCAAIALITASLVVAIGSAVVAGFNLDQALKQQAINSEIYLSAIADLTNYLDMAAEICADANNIEARGGQGAAP